MPDSAAHRVNERGEAPHRARAHGLREIVGERVGELWAPGIAALSRFRRARMFHPTGVVLRGRADPVGSRRFGALGSQLAGPVLGRFSQAMWKSDVELFDVLGIALRFRHGDGPRLDAGALPGDQDLLFATILSPLTMPLAPFTTDATDYFTNRYWAVAPFAVAGQGRVKLRLRPAEPSPGRGSRRDRLLAAVGQQRARFVLEARRTLRPGWEAIAELRFDEVAAIDQEALRFDAFRAGAGIVPVGFVHSIRKAAYAAGQHARSRHV